MPDDFDRVAYDRERDAQRAREWDRVTELSNLLQAHTAQQVEANGKGDRILDKLDHISQSQEDGRADHAEAMRRITLTERRVEVVEDRVDVVEGDTKTLAATDDTLLTRVDKLEKQVAALTAPRAKAKKRVVAFPARKARRK